MLIHPIGELVTGYADNKPLHGQDLDKVTRIKDAAVAVCDGVITHAGPASEVLPALKPTSDTVRVDASASLVTAGLVDPHTHLVFAGNRANEFLLRCQGKTYAEIARAGGGIVASMNATRNAGLEELIASGLRRLKRMLASGTTTCEVKTGYGLDMDSELRMLEAIVQLNKMQPVDLIPTFMPAHAIPPGMESSEYVTQVVEQMLPAAAAKCTANDLLAFNDVFCDEGYFSLEQTRVILESGAKLGLKPKVHADEFANLGATALAVGLKAASADHLLSVSNHEIELLANSDTVAVLLPGTSFYLNLVEHAPARKMIEHGVAVALGSDFNPGSCHIFSLPFIWGLACLHLKMTPAEALNALTINAAFAVGKADKVGQVRSGYRADLLVYAVPALEEIPYNLGWNPVAVTIKNGQIVHRA